MRERFVAGLDVGTTKVCAAAARVRTGSAELVGVGVARSAGVKRGLVVDMKAAEASIRDAIEECGKASGLDIGAVYLGVSGPHVECMASYGATGIKGRHVAESDIRRVMDAARALYVPLDREVLHAAPVDYVIDGQGGIVRPVGMSGVRIEANVCVVTASHAAVKNIETCCERAGLKVVETVFKPFASARAVLGPYEADSDVVIIDIGGGTTEVALFRDGALRRASVLPIGGGHLTSDIAIGLKLSLEEAEGLKKQSGYAVCEAGPPGIIEVGGADGRGRQMAGHYLGEIIIPRCEEIFSMAKDTIKDAILYDSPKCVVLIGGSALLRGIDRVAEAVIGLPARVGFPARGTAVVFESGYANPAFAVPLGLLLYALDEERDIYDELAEGAAGRLAGWFRGLLDARKWVIGLR